jgi:hypothetical protein
MKSTLTARLFCHPPEKLPCTHTLFEQWADGIVNGAYVDAKVLICGLNKLLVTRVKGALERIRQEEVAWASECGGADQQTRIHLMGLEMVFKFMQRIEGTVRYWTKVASDCGLWGHQAAACILLEDRIVERGG